MCRPEGVRGGVIGPRADLFGPRTSQSATLEATHESDFPREQLSPSTEAATPGSITGESSAGELTLVSLVTVLLQRRRLMLGLPFLACVAVLVISLVLPPTYTASVVFAPETSAQGVSLPTGVAGLAAQFGMPVSAAGAGSPAFYGLLLTSRTIIDQVLASPQPVPGAEDGRVAPLLDILPTEGEPEARRQQGRNLLLESILPRIDAETGVVTLTVATKDPLLSATVANTFIDFLTAFNLESRRSNAEERRIFLDDRLLHAEKEMDEAEDSLRVFLEGNRRISGSPTLQFEGERLQRGVMLKNEVLLTLRREYEEARIEEVDQRSRVTVIDVAVPPIGPSSPNVPLNVMLALLGSVVLATTVALAGELAHQSRRRHATDYAALDAQWRAIKRGLNPWNRSV